MDDGRNTGSNRSERAHTLLARIAELLRVDTAFFLSPPSGRESSLTPESDPAELVRIFRSIGDSELRRSVLAMLRDLETRNDTSCDS